MTDRPPQRPSRRYVRLVLALRAAWLLPVSALALIYAGFSLFTLLRVLFFPMGVAWRMLPNALFGAAVAGLFLFFTWRIWRKTWDIVTDRVYPEKSAAAWQVCWIVLAVILPALAIWPKAVDVFRYVGEGENKSRLAALRSAAEQYRAAKGAYPARLEAVRDEGFLKELPPLWDERFTGFPHEATSAAAVYRGEPPRDTGGWGYEVSVPSAPLIFMDCTHPDPHGRPWSAY